MPIKALLRIPPPQPKQSSLHQEPPRKFRSFFRQGSFLGSSTTSRILLNKPRYKLWSSEKISAIFSLPLWSSSSLEILGLTRMYCGALGVKGFNKWWWCASLHQKARSTNRYKIFVNKQKMIQAMIHFHGFSALWCNFPFRVAKRLWSF